MRVCDICAFHSSCWKNNVSCESDEEVWGKERTEREQLKTRMMGVAVLRITPMMKDTLIYSTAPDTETKNLSVLLSCSLCSCCRKENLFLISIFPPCFAVKTIQSFISFIITNVPVTQICLSNLLLLFDLSFIVFFRLCNGQWFLPVKKKKNRVSVSGHF